MANEFVARKGIISLGGITFPYQGVSLNYTATTDDYYINAEETTSGSICHLPTAIGIEGKQYVIKNSTSDQITIDPFSSQTIDGNSTLILGSKDSIKLISDGTNWYIDSIGAPISGATNNAILTSNGTVGGISARSNVTYDGNTLREKQTSSGTTYSEIETFSFSNIVLTPGERKVIFQVSKTDLETLSCNCNLFSLSSLSFLPGRRNGTITGYPLVSSSSSRATRELTSGTIGTRPYFSADTFSAFIQIGLPPNFGGPETVLNGEFVCQAIRRPAAT